MLSSVKRFVIVVVVGAVSTAWQAPPKSTTPGCQAAGQLVRLRDLPEASGIAASRRTPGIFWAHNDSAEPAIFALDEQGTVKGRVRLTGATVEDWEDIAVAPCSQGSCVFVADIGDNDGSRKQVTVYRVPEPIPGDSASAPVEAFHAAYPDGAHDAESLFVSGESALFLITKGSPGPVAVYRFPPALQTGRTLKLERVGEPLTTGETKPHDRPTAAAASPDGRWVAVRTTRWIAFYPTRDLISGRWREAFRMDLNGVGESQGEGVTFAGNTDLVLVGEAGGPFGGQGTFARLACTFPAQ